MIHVCIVHLLYPPFLSTWFLLGWDPVNHRKQNYNDQTEEETRS